MERLFRGHRGHFLTESALTTKLLRDFLIHDVQTEVTKENNAEECEILEVEVTENDELGNNEIYPEFVKDVERVNEMFGIRINKT